MSCHELEVHPSSSSQTSLGSDDPQVGLDCCLPKTIPKMGKNFRPREEYLPGTWWATPWLCGGQSLVVGVTREASGDEIGKVGGAGMRSGSSHVH